MGLKHGAYDSSLVFADEDNAFQVAQTFQEGVKTPTVEPPAAVQEDDATTGVRMRDNYIVLPDCPDDLETMEFGAMCKSPIDGKIKIRDASGVRDL